jgi:hypothetical protein
MLWAELEPTVTASINDALPVASVWWNGQSVTKVNDARPIARSLQDARRVFPEDEAMLSGVLQQVVNGGNWIDLIAEDFKNPRYQDVVLSRRDRHSIELNTVEAEETIPAWSTDGTMPPPAREWYYSRPVMLPATQHTLWVELFHATQPLTQTQFGGTATVQAQLMPSSSPSTLSPWTTMTPLNQKMFSLSLSASYPPASPTYFKVRFRIAGKALRGFSAAMRQS